MYQPPNIFYSSLQDMPYRRKRCYRQPREAGGEPMVLSRHTECSIASGEKGGNVGRSIHADRSRSATILTTPMKISAKVVNLPKQRAEMIAEI